MVTLDVAATWTRILSVTAGACTAAGAPGPATRIAGKAAVTWLEGPWLGIFDFAGLRRSEREILESFIREHAEPLLLVRHLLLAKPLGGDIFVELTPQAQEAMPEGWRDAPRPILFLAPAGRVTRERRRQYLADDRQKHRPGCIRDCSDGDRRHCVFRQPADSRQLGRFQRHRYRGHR